MLNRPDALEVRGGDTVQMQETARALRGLDVEVDLSTELTSDLAVYDLVHLFNLNRPDSTSIQARHARARGKPFVLTPIHQLMERYDRGGRPHGLSALYRALPEGVMNRVRAWYLRRPYRDKDKAWILRHAAAVLPATDVEADRLRLDFGETGPLRPVPNGVRLDPTPNAERSGVLCAARIEPFKNQRALIRALEGTGIRLRLAGTPSPRHRRWAERCLEELESAGGEYLGELRAEALWRAYAEAEVHVLASWFESQSLSCLEAAWHGCRIVCTSVGYARGYLGGDAWYCDPGDEGSIRRAIEQALDAEPSNGLRERVAREFTWPRTAERTLAVYREVLSDQTAGVGAGGFEPP